MLDILRDAEMTDRKPSKWAIEGLHALEQAVAEAIERKRQLGQYWVEWDGERPVKVWPDGRREPAE